MLGKALVLLQITGDNTHSDLDKELVEKRQLLHTIRQKKTEAENILTNIIRQFSNRYRNPLQALVLESTEFHITNMTNLRPLLTGGGLARPNQNANQPNLQLHGNQLINEPY